MMGDILKLLHLWKHKNKTCRVSSDNNNYNKMNSKTKSPMNMYMKPCNRITKRHHYHKYMEHWRWWIMCKNCFCLLCINCYLLHTQYGGCWSTPLPFYALRLHARRQKQLIEPIYSHAVCVVLAQLSSSQLMFCHSNLRLSSMKHLMHSNATHNSILTDCLTAYNVHCVPFCFCLSRCVVHVWNWLRLVYIKNYNVCCSFCMKSIVTETQQCTITPSESVISCQTCLNEFTLPSSHFSWHARWGLLMKRFTARQTIW